MEDVKRRRREYWAGLAAVLVAGGLAALQTWPVPPAVEGSMVDVLLRDRVIVGLLRMSVVVAALYGIASVPALVVGGRWVKGVGTAGIVADERHREIPAVLEHLEGEVADLRLDLERVTRERDELLSLLDARTDPY